MGQDDLATLGDILRNGRIEAGLSTRQLAKMVGVHHSYVAHIESGLKSNPSAEHLQNFADALKLDAIELLTHIGLRPSSTLPSPRMYFRRKFGVSEDEAEVLARIIEHQMKEGKGNDESINHEGGEQPHR